jgi:uncharacterized protein YciI
MKFVVLFEDNPDAGQDVRRRHMPAHLAFLDEYKDRIQSAGPLYDRNNAAVGGLWIVNADDTETVEQLINVDPLRNTGLRKSWKTLHWAQVFENGEKLL